MFPEPNTDQALEKGAYETLQFLIKTSTLLSESLDYETALANVVRLAVPYVADWCAVDLVSEHENRNVVRVAVSHSDAEKVKLALDLQKRYPADPNAEHGAYAVIRSGEAEFYSHIHDSLLVKAARDEEHLHILRALGLCSAIVLPLKAHGKTFGALTLVMAESGRNYTQTQFTVAKELAHRASIAVENARLLRDTQHQLAKCEALSKELQSQQHRLEVALKAANACVWELDMASGQILRFGYPPECIADLTDLPSVLQRLHPEDRDTTIKRLMRSMQGGSDYVNEVRAIDTNGETRWLMVHGRAIRSDAKGEWKIVGTTVDVTDKKRTEEAIRMQDRLATMGRLAASIAHEINNPLEALNLHLYIAQQQAMSPEVRTHLSAAANEIRRVSEIVARTMGFHRDSKIAVPVDICDVVDSALAMYTVQITRNNVQVRCETPKGFFVLGFPGELRQVLSNLVRNAIEAMPTGGHLVVRCKPEYARGRLIAVRVTVADSGTGIPVSTRHKLFDPLFTTKGEGGSGLGLWVTKGIVEKHGGTIRFRSFHAGQRSGTCFQVVLPAADASMAVGQ